MGALENRKSYENEMFINLLEIKDKYESYQILYLLKTTYLTDLNVHFIKKIGFYVNIKDWPNCLKKTPKNQSFNTIRMSPNNYTVR